MKIEVLGCSGGESPERRLTCLLINDQIALDAGSLTQGLELERQAQVGSLVLTHSHLDHTNSIPFFIENVYGLRREAIDLYASKATIYALRRNLFNDASWPDFTRLPHHLLPAIQFHELESELPVTLHGVRFTPIEDSTEIEFEVPPTGAPRVPARVAIYDLTGRVVRILFEGDVAPGTRALSWAGLDARGKEVRPGVYFCRLDVAGLSEVRKMLLTR